MSAHYRQYYTPQVIGKVLNFPYKFQMWLESNINIWTEFCKLADQVRKSGHDHWSARVIAEVMRWNFVVRDQTDPTYKINNNWTPMMARLYNEVYGTNFFEQRTQR